MKPRVYWVYYPKLKRGFWRVSMLPNNPAPIDSWRWYAAHEAVTKVNNKIVREDNNADQASREMRRQSH